LKKLRKSIIDGRDLDSTTKKRGMSAAQENSTEIKVMNESGKGQARKRMTTRR